MSKDPMRVLPDDLFPPEVKTPEERFELLGRRVFAANPEEAKKWQADYSSVKPKRKRGRTPEDPSPAEG